MKNILILSGSPRKAGNSELLCDQFAKGATEAGHAVTKVWLGNKKIGFCTACYTCQNNGKCPQQDDVAPILEQMLKADVIVLSTPVYFYTMSAQLKALIDRSVAIYPTLAKKTFYFIMTMADTDESMFTGTVEALRGFVACCEGSEEAGIISAGGVYKKGEILNHPAFEQAYKVGLQVK